MDEAYDKLDRGLIEVMDSMVIVDCLTNHVRETRNGGRALTIDELVWCEEKEEKGEEEEKEEGEVEEEEEEEEKEEEES